MNFLKENMLDIGALFIAFLAFIFSIINHKDNKKTSKTTTEKTLNKEFFERIYFDYMIDKLPSALSDLESKSENACDECESMEKIVLEILDKSIFYKYFDSDFYNKIKAIIIKLDEELVLAGECRNNTLFRERRDNIIRLTQNLYEILRLYYSGM